ncbi:peptidase M14 [Actinoalloteichus sp. AHMU CJ021]|uniref:Zinc carboxypeptidase n=1 Tax=Actinoalloteichus caeruleus DSM 43889 TaxID=1120930 RepID=A0ABT1JF98_ACTCY|nr:M14 family zinc carboxypeptidase [Actinoalloteichus caeruleus]AUS77352.1 peptidase M14 [Actinoalloteichus sp. AHMU CJ021]MCP2331172.1 Zinc carboxypeptidase [Actinoalloteichus caeruleus DSM 43889]
MPTVRRTLAAITGTLMLGTFGVLPTATAAPPPSTADTARDAPRQEPAERCSTRPQDNPVDAFTDYEELLVELDRIEAESRGRVQVDQIGTSNRGRLIQAARVGDGDTVVLLTSEIHGNEKTGTDAILWLLDHLGRSNSRFAQEVRSELTVVAVPKMNPDAAELNRRGNDMTWDEVVDLHPQLAGAEPAWNYITNVRQGHDYGPRPGFDINRDYNPDLSYVPDAADLPGNSARPGWFLSPETQAVRDLYVDLTEEFGTVDTYVDIHHQGPCYVMPGTDDYVTLSLSGKFVADPNTEEGARYAEYADRYDLDYAKQLNVAAYDALRDASAHRPEFAHVSLYPQDVDLPGTGLGSFALNGSGSVLFEVRGQSQDLGERHRVMLTQAVYVGVEGILRGVASGQVRDLDPADYDAIPPRGPVVTTDQSRTLADPLLDVLER